MPTPQGNGQMGHLISESRDWVRDHGFDALSMEELSTRDAIKIALASHDYIVERISRSLARPLWGVAIGVGGGLFTNATVQALKWILGAP